MPRRARIKFDNTPVHLIQRGNNRTACFFADDDYQFYLHHLAEACREEGVKLHAYVLMTNHVHLLLTPTETGAPSRLMQSLGRRYVQYANRFYRRTGSLWEGRYKSSVVQAESYLLACSRYIELNPVKAGMVLDPGQYRWSSYRANGLGLVDQRLTPHALYRQLGLDSTARQAAYRSLFRPELDDAAAKDIRKSLQLGMPVGSKRFAETICTQLGIRHNTGQRGRLNRLNEAPDDPQPSTGQADFGF